MPPPPELSPAAVVGAGRLGRALAVALDRLGVPITLGVRAATAAAGGTDPATGLPRAGAVSAATGAGLVLLCVSDDELPGLVAELAGAGVLGPGTTVAHTAGVDGIGLLAPAAAAGAGTAACHPVQTFTDDLDATLARLPGSVWGLTADAAGLPAATALVAALGGVAVAVPEAGRAGYHAALVLAANGAAALSAAAADLLRAGGVTDPGAVLAKVVHASVDSALETGQAGLSGPWVRGDGRTVALHLEALGTQAGRPGHRALVAAYASLARLVGDRAVAAGRLDPRARERLDAIVAGAAP